MLTNSSKNAIRAAIYLSINSGDEKKYSPQQIADVIEIPAPFLAKTLQQLSKHGIISSTKGRHGGFYLTDANKKNTVLSIIECIDGLDKLSSCFLGLPKCNETNPCAIHHLVAPLRNSLVKELSNKTIEEFSISVLEKEEYVI